MLQEKAITVNLCINAWSARKHDKKITAEVEDQHQAKDAGRYNKLLIAKEEMQKIQKATSAARTFHYENTLPWSNNGDRLLPAANYFDYVKKMQELKNDFETAVNVFLNNYDTVIEDAKIRLNGMFNAVDYPTKNEIGNKFGFKTDFFPLPETDFRISIGQAEINVLKMGMENAYNDRLRNAMQDIKTRIKEQLEHMKVKLSEKDAIFKNSLFDNLRDIINLMPKLNITGDMQVTEICNDMQTLLIDPQTVRDNSITRSRKAQEVENILNKFEDFFS